MTSGAFGGNPHTPQVAPRFTPEQFYDVVPGLILSIPMVDQGSLIINNDTVNAVWISTNAGVTPGAGIRIGALGSITWTQGVKTLYACVDTGVTSKVSIAVSSNAQNPDNPVDVGVSVAQQILLNGVPNVGLVDQLYNNVLNNGGNTGIIDVTKYASLVLVANDVANPNRTYCLQASYQQAGNSEYLSSIDNLGNATSYAWVIPTYAARTMKIYVVSNGTVGLIVYGTNRLVTRAQSLGPYGEPRLFHLNATALAANSITTLPCIDKIGSGVDNRPYLQNNGLCYFRAAIAGAGSGDIGYQYIDIDGITVQTVYVSSFAAVGTNYGLMTLPPSVLRPVYRSAVAATTAVDFLLTPVPSTG